MKAADFEELCESVRQAGAIKRARAKMTLEDRVKELEDESDIWPTHAALLSMLTEAVAAEREACARIADHQMCQAGLEGEHLGMAIASKIRARGQSDAFAG